RFKRWIPYGPLRPMAGGALVALAGSVLAVPQYLGLGIPTIEAAFRGPLPVYDFVGKFGFTVLTLAAGFKGGERQRVWLAMLIAQDSRCVLLDEPTSALDIGHQLEVLQLIRTLCEARGMTAVVVLHDVNMATRFCTQLVSLRHGRVLMQASPEEIMREDSLEAIYGVPMGVMTDPVGGHRIGYPR
ncbi:Fe3+-hydroxamate ABC transporter ATP-binding protein FhuC, partial [Burkholderia gladioli]|nr:Fe3+-hydroxamate ABC transporter ATP-binding protein FhuC [Burkholderia gladioli]